MEKRINTYFEERIADCQAAAAALSGDNRTDEAVFEKIRMNVFNIFRQVSEAGGSVSGGDEVKLLSFLLDRLDRIPASWQTSMEMAMSHGNSEKVHIEQIKLAVAAEIRQKVLEWSEGK